MSLLIIRNLSISIKGRPLLENADLTVDPGRRIGLIGRNGAGKSTLMRAISGDLAVDGGDIRLANRAKMGAVAQEAPGGSITPVAVVLAADKERTALLAEAEAAETDALRLAEVHERLRTIESDSAPARAGAILSGLGFSLERQQGPMSALSGGWRMRVALASALFGNPDLLLLDEPTNHLDLEASLWLEGWLAKFPGAALIVSHDRGLLDRSVEAIAHLDRGKITLTTGGFAEFLRLRAERSAQQKRMAEKVTAERDRIQAFVDRFRAKATKARQAQSRLKALERLPPVENVIEDAPTRFSFPDPSRIAPPILTLDRVSIGYAGKPVLKNISLNLDTDDRVALLGANGNGKSTLAKLIGGSLEALSGEVRRAAGLKVGYFAQDQAEALIPGETPVDHMARALPRALPPQVRAQLARFGLDADRADTKVSELSGGEKGRLLLALATRDAPHLLILDEPTNHLDIDAKEALIRALADYTGAVLLITHDPHLVELVADSLWLVADGTAAQFDGDMDDYRQRLAGLSSGPGKVDTAPTRQDDRRERAEARAALAPLRKIAQDAEKKIAKLTADKDRIEAILADPGFYEKHGGAEITRGQQKLAAIAREIEAAEEAWLEAQGALEEAG
ncbi:ABC-F family ATP-binding cassette domain-containing protein [Acidisoma cellulosilytica]|uniref:ABC-F family ATP-binding cassette domain-containing protein n=1 Tax=Acidisoma cellulosilyticum TaxID=2802395 RepID=A0A963YZH5_9PROT|nr:ABC-F family ATP-binding cassette domain-containing protein [Acidisoma cellulosilyticum]MCB8879222.1 ABC-F family ATP-binding cassette domain-containing protein [Acidisoma cellulosilyticum]